MLKNKKRIIKIGGINKPLGLHNSFFSKNYNKSCFSIGSSCYEPISFWSHDMAACCYFGVNLRNQLDQNFPSRLPDVIPLSFSDLLISSLLLPFTWTNYFKSNSLSPLYSLDKVFSVQIPLLSLLLWTYYFKSNFLSDL